jgi:hypothetical protein
LCRSCTGRIFDENGAVHGPWVSEERLVSVFDELKALDEQRSKVLNAARMAALQKAQVRSPT